MLLFDAAVPYEQTGMPMTYCAPRLSPLHFQPHHTQKHSERDDWRITRMRQAITQSHGTAALTLDSFSGELGVTPTHLGKRFKQTSGTSFRHLTVHLRQEHAALLLEDTEMPIKEIAAVEGYKYVSDFTNCFKRLYGISPRTYRDLIKQAVSESIRTR